MIHAIVCTVGALAAEALMNTVLERWQHLLIIRSDIGVIRQLVFNKRLLGGTSTRIRYMRVLRIP